MPIPTESERLGTTLDGRYVLRSILGRGGMGVVYAAEHALTGRTVAVKLVRPELADDPRYAERLFREARAAASLQHPNVVDVLDMGALEDGGLYLVLEHLAGFDLATVLDVEGPLAVERVLRVIDPVLDALEALHAKGIVHRDLKPSNVFLTRRGVVEVPKLLDFGIAKLRDARSSTTTGRILGTPWYMSPEQAAGDVEAGPEVDVWAVGAMLFECLSGRVPFDGPTPTAVLMNVLRYDAPTLELPDAPHVAEAVRRAMSKGDDRLRSAAALREALQGRALGGAETRAPEVRGAPGSAARAPDELAVTRNLARPDVAPKLPPRRGVVAIAVAVVAAVLAIGWVASREDEPPPTVVEHEGRVVEEATRDAPAPADTRVDSVADVAPIADEVVRTDGAGGSQTSAASSAVSFAPSSSAASSVVSGAPSSAASSARSSEDAPRRVGRTVRRAGDAADEPSRATSPPAPTNAPPSSEPSRTPDPSERSGEPRPTEPSLRTRW